MKILIIGSKGFIGSHLCEHLASLGEIYKCDVLPSPNEINYSQLLLTNSNFEMLFQKEQYDWCINASGNGNVSKSFEDPFFDYQLNVANVFKILEAIRKYNNNCKFINFSSAAVYGNPDKLPVEEKDRTQPLSPYGYHKLISEQICQSYRSNFGVKSFSLRVFSAYGPRLRKQLFWDTFQKTKGQKVVSLFGTGQESRDFIFIDDLCEAVICVMRSNNNDFSTINISSGVESTIEEVANIFVKTIASDIEVKFNGQVHLGNPNNWRADISLLKACGFSAQNSVKDGLTKTAKWLKENE